MYEYVIINEHSQETLGYANTIQEAEKKAEDMAHRYGSQRISVWMRMGTYEAARVWK
jgi:hypothetical protein